MDTNKNTVVLELPAYDYMKEQIALYEKMKNKNVVPMVYCHINHRKDYRNTVWVDRDDAFERIEAVNVSLAKRVDSLSEELKQVQALQCRPTILPVPKSKSNYGWLAFGIGLGALIVYMSLLGY